ncbi:hypothetical protein [Tabrizicola sp.]|uniref:hypothetical protein n=1 Tax=Tabrizicola sp. TaxID=2005166 RepID=UPI002FDEA779
MLKPFAALLLSAVLAGSALAGALEDASALCSDPMTTGPEKREQMLRYGFTPAQADPQGALGDLAMAHILPFANDLPDLEARFAAAPVLAGNIARMIAEGTISLWQREGALLAFSIGQTPEGTEHVTCLFAGPPSDDLQTMFGRYGEPEDLPHLETLALRFDETAINMQTETRYRMISIWSRLTSDPPRTPLADAYRLERIEEPADG